MLKDCRDLGGGACRSAIKPGALCFTSNSLWFIISHEHDRWALGRGLALEQHRSWGLTMRPIQLDQIREVK